MDSKALASVLAYGVPCVRAALMSLCRGHLRGVHGAFPVDFEIEDGYPSAARVDEIACVSIRDSGRWLRDVLPSVINALPCGRAEVQSIVDDFGRPRTRITVITGGWSGCEDVVYAVLDHPVMRLRVATQQRGGLYVFDVEGCEGG